MTAGPEVLKTSVEITGTVPPNISVKVGGHLLPCESVTLEIEHDDLPWLVVRLPLAEGVVVSLDEALPVFAEASREALIAMGWTPPKPKPEPSSLDSFWQLRAGVLHYPTGETAPTMTALCARLLAAGVLDEVQAASLSRLYPARFWHGLVPS